MIIDQYYIPAYGSGDTTEDLHSILKEIKQGCPAHERHLVKARELQDWYDGDSEKYLAFRPAEDALSWLTRPKRVSFITRQAINKLTSHLYKPGPRHRRITADATVDAWYNRVAQDIQLNGLMQHADRLASLHGLCAIGIYPTGNPARPINYHFFPRYDFVFWCSSDDPRVPTAVCTITKSGPETIRYRLWTSTHYYTFFKGKSWGYQPGGWNVARFDPASSGPHPYGVLPFVFITHELPTADLEGGKGLGHLLQKINRAVNVDKSNLALWVHHYARPLGFVSGVGPEWRPRFIEGGFVPLVVRRDSTEDGLIVPDVKYLESNLDIGAIRGYITAEANQALAELDVPLTVQIDADGGGGAKLASGVSIAAQDADLITYAKRRQPLFELHETRLAQLICRIGACPAAGLPGLALALTAVADDPSLRVSWPEPSIDIPGPDRDQADTFELTYNLTDPIELLMRRQGLTEGEAIDQYRAIQRRKQIAAALQADPSAAVPVPADDQAPEFDDDGDVIGVDGGENADMGIQRPTDGTPQVGGAGSVESIVSATVAVDPQMPIPAAPLILPATPGYGSWGTES
jgi:hypothetical protein